MAAQRQPSGDPMYALTVLDPSRWPAMRLVNVDEAGYFELVISGWRCLDGTVYPPPELAAGAGWRDALAAPFLGNLAEDSAFDPINPDSD